MTRRRATLTLGGGGARGIAHLGAIEELLSAGFSVERIVGVSIGGLVGAMFAFEPDIARVQHKANAFLNSPQFQRHQRHLFGMQFATPAVAAGTIASRYRRLAGSLRANRLLYQAVRHSSILPGELLEQVVDHLLPDADIADARIPFSVVAVDLHSGRPVVFDKGSLRLAVRASASVPGIFPPVAFEGKLLSDIGGFSDLPLGVARSYAPRLLVAVDVGADLKPLARLPSAVEILLRMNDIGAALFREYVAAQADLVILPDVGHVEWFDFTSANAMIAAGRAATKLALTDFAPRPTWLQRLFARPGS